MSDDITLLVLTPATMIPVLKSIRKLANDLYGNTDLTVTGTLLSKTPDPLERARIKMLFDFIFFYSLLLTPVIFILMYGQDYTNLVIHTVFLATFVLCAFMMMMGVGTAVTGTLAALNTLVMPMLSSFTNDLDVSLLYAIPWMMACLLGYFVSGMRTAVALGVILFLYLGLVAFIKIRHIPVFLATSYSAPDKYVATPFIMAAYLLVCLRVWGHYYRNLARQEKLHTIEKQQQYSALVAQNLTKQFLLLKGLSRSGKTEYREGNTELLDACFSEIEKQCDTAINFLDGSKTE